MRESNGEALQGPKGRSGSTTDIEGNTEGMFWKLDMQGCCRGRMDTVQAQNGLGNVCHARWLHVLLVTAGKEAIGLILAHAVIAALFPLGILLLRIPLHIICTGHGFPIS